MPFSLSLHRSDLCTKTPSWWYPSGKNDRLAARRGREVRGHFRKEKEVWRLHLRRSENVCVYHFLQAAQSHQLMCPYGPLLNKQTVGCSGTVQRDLCSATRNQTFSGGEEKLLFSWPILWIKQSASSKCSDKDMNFCMYRVDLNGEPNANQPTHLLILP